MTGGTNETCQLYDRVVFAKNSSGMQTDLWIRSGPKRLLVLRQDVTGAGGTSFANETELLSMIAESDASAPLYSILGQLDAFRDPKDGGRFGSSGVYDVHIRISSCQEKGSHRLEGY